MFFGETQCEGTVKRSNQRCSNRAYYAIGDKNLCGVHSRIFPNRVKLPKDPKAAEKKAERILQRKTLEEAAASKNREENKRGQVICTRFRMMKETKHVDGFVKIFPNRRHGKRRDGFGCPSLSPMNLGPIEHEQPGLVPALNLENFHQGNKVFPHEIVNEETIKDCFFKLRDKMYTDKVPHRHKKGAKGNVPVCSIFVSKDGKINRLSYFESRELYCHFYEKLCTLQEEFKTLVKMLDDGYNLQITGYDAYDVSNISILDAYKDTSKPFGHELVLYTLLTEEPENYPWRIYKKYMNE